MPEARLQKTRAAYQQEKQYVACLHPRWTWVGKECVCAVCGWHQSDWDVKDTQ